jgi:ribosomal protein L7/L12
MSEPPPTDPTSDEAGSGQGQKGQKGLRGWLARRAEATLRKPRRALPALTEPGECQVVLQLIGHSPVTVVTVISEATGLDFMSASELAKDAPAVVVSGISEASADRVVERLQKAGARAVVGETYRPV